MKNYYYESDERTDFIEANNEKEALELAKFYYKDEEILELREETDEEKRRHILKTTGLCKQDIEYYMNKEHCDIQTPEEFFDAQQESGDVEDVFEDFENKELLPTNEDFKKGNYSKGLHDWLLKNVISYGDTEETYYLGQKYIIGYWR